MITPRARSFIKIARVGTVIVTLLGVLSEYFLPGATSAIFILGGALWLSLTYLLAQADIAAADFAALAAAYQRAVDAQKRAVRSRHLTPSR